LGNHHLRLGLRSGWLLDEDELSAIPIAALAAEQKNHLQRKADLAVKILMKAVVPACFVVQHQGRGLGLLGLVANFQESGMFRRIRRSLFTKSFRPAIRNCGEVRISVAPELGDQFWERIGEIFVIANTEAIALHDDVAAKTRSEEHTSELQSRFDL